MILIFHDVMAVYPSNLGSENRSISGFGSVFKAARLQNGAENLETLKKCTIVEGYLGCESNGRSDRK